MLKRVRSFQNIEAERHSGEARCQTAMHWKINTYVRKVSGSRRAAVSYCLVPLRTRAACVLFTTAVTPIYCQHGGGVPSQQRCLTIHTRIPGMYVILRITPQRQFWRSKPLKNIAALRVGNIA